ncbi:MAG TPA: acyltransferase domain-containing protein, partial [Vicinamibacterales bacterium]|nr:acyltransferase domain-containing protein [Vicinamibacterales bacterium]
MARSLLAGEPIFRAVVDDCDRLFRRHGSWSLLDELMADEAHSRVAGAELAPAANFAVQAGLLALWKSWGVTPAAVVGHSAGEIAAAYASGALDLDEAARVAFYRGFLQQRASGLGGMMAAGERLEVLQPLIDRYPGRVAIAAINSPTSLTLCGDTDAIAEIAAALEQQRTFCRVMSVDVPYHSQHLDMIRGDTLEALAELRTRRPSVPIISEVTGEWMRDEPFDAAYWWRNTREPVRFADAVLRLVADGYTTFLEVGPHPVLAASITECLKHAGVEGTCLPSLRRNEEDRRILLRTAAALHARGVPIEWERVLGRPRSRVELPSYPWNKERVWFEGARVDTSAAETRRDHTRILGSRIRAVQPHWETNLASPSLAYIGDHRIHNAIVFPGAAYVAMALDAATELGYEDPTLEHVEFRKALFLPDDMRTRVQAVFDPSSGELSVHAQPDEDAEAPWIAHATCRIVRAARVARPSLVLADVRARCTTPLPRDAFYSELKRRGFTFGARFEGLESIQMGDGEALGFVRLPDSHAVELTGRVHPALFDAGLQVLIAAVMSGQAAGSRSPGFLPTHAARIAAHASIGASFWSHARLSESTGDGFEGSVAIFDDAGTCLLEIEGLRAKTLESAHETARSAAAGRYTYELRWEERKLTTTPAHDQAAWCSPAMIATRAGAEADRLSAECGFAGYYRELEPRFEAITRAFFVNALVDLGVDLRPGSRFGTSILPDKSPLIGARRRQFD